MGLEIVMSLSHYCHVTSVGWGSHVIATVLSCDLYVRIEVVM